MKGFFQQLCCTVDRGGEVGNGGGGVGVATLLRELMAAWTRAGVIQGEGRDGQIQDMSSRKSEWDCRDSRIWAERARRG